MQGGHRRRCGERGRHHGRRVRANGDEHRMPGKGGSGFCGEQEAVAGAGGGWPQDLSPPNCDGELTSGGSWARPGGVTHQLGDLEQVLPPWEPGSPPVKSRHTE